MPITANWLWINSVDDFDLGEVPLLSKAHLGLTSCPGLFWHTTSLISSGI